MTLAERIKHVNRTKRPENSVLLRVTVLATVMIGVLATWVSGAADAADAILALVLLPLGAWLSYHRREGDNLGIKAALTIGAMLALWRFFGDVRMAVTVDDTRAPLAALFLGVQVLHGFDLPQRRDLGFTLASSLALLALAGTTTHAGTFGVLLLAYAALTAVSMMAMQRSAARERADDLRTGERLTPLRFEPPAGSRSRRGRGGAASPVAGSLARSGAGILRASGPVLLIGLLVFLLLPRSQAQRFGGLPFKGLQGQQLSSPLISNPGLEGEGQGPSDDGGPLQFNPEAYFGFAEYVDLRTAGELSDDPILRVRADRPRFWRGMVFDEYTGQGWTRSSEQPRPTYGLPISLTPPDGSGPDGPAPNSRREAVVQTYEVLAEAPNLLFAAGDPIQVFVAGGAVTQWDDGTVATSQLQEEGTVYSVVSQVNLTPPDLLRTRTGRIDPELQNRYTQLPDDVPARVRELSAELTAGNGTIYEKAESVQEWIGANTKYTLDTPAAPLKGDLVDHFLFESQEGWCEPIAASMVVLLRAADIPARFVTGFQPGDRNPISGVWDVKMSNAHAWVEVFIPHEGWIAFDPTGAVPQAVDGRDTPRVPLLELGRMLRDGALAVIPGPVKAAGSTLLGAVRAEPLTAGGITALLSLLAGAGVLLGRRQRAVERERLRPPTTAFDRFAAMLGDRGVPRDQWQTPREYAARIRLRAGWVPAEDVEVLVAAEESARYGGPPPAPDVEQSLERIRGVAAERDAAEDTRRR